LKGELPAKSADHHGLAYDSKRDRLLLFSDLDKRGGDVSAYEIKTGQATWLEPTGRNKALLPCRETIYVPELDGVLIGGHVTAADGKLLWPLYDCNKNAWVGVELVGEDPVGKGKFNNSMGLMYDPGRKLIWAVGQNSHVHVARIDPATLARSADLK
jgi:hypothetical protein